MSTRQYSKGAVKPDEVIDFLDNVLESSTEYSIIAKGGYTAPREVE